MATTRVKPAVDYVKLNSVGKEQSSDEQPTEKGAHSDQTIQPNLPPPLAENLDEQIARKRLEVEKKKRQILQNLEAESIKIDNIVQSSYKTNDSNDETEEEPESIDLRKARRQEIAPGLQNKNRTKEPAKSRTTPNKNNVSEQLNIHTLRGMQRLQDEVNQKLAQIAPGFQNRPITTKTNKTNKTKQKKEKKIPKDKDIKHKTKKAMAEACAPSLPNNSFNGNALGVDVCEATLGIIGMGSIGYKIAQRAKGFDMKILYYNRSRRPEEIENSVGATFVPKLHDLLPQCDFVVVICPLSAETKGLIGAEEFNLMKPTATIVNIARGGVIDTEALVAALKEKKIRGAGLDVTDPEPLPRGHVLFDFPNVIVTPHHASATVQTRMKMARLMLANVLACLEGRPMPTPVN